MKTFQHQLLTFCFTRPQITFRHTIAGDDTSIGHDDDFELIEWKPPSKQTATPQSVKRIG